MSEYIGKRVIPRHDGEWDANKAYEPLCLVLDENGDSYISRKEVPAGTQLSNTNYWALSARFSEQVKLATDHMDAAVEEMEQENADTVKAVNETCENTVAAVNKTAQENIAAINKTASDTVAAVKKTCDAAVETVNKTCTDTVSSVTEKTDDVVADTKQVQTSLTTRMDTLEKRIDANVAASTVRNRDYAAEVVDARVGHDGTTYDSLGKAVRSHAEYLETRGAEIVHEQFAEKYMGALYRKAEKNLHPGEVNYKIYNSSTFSGWVSLYTITEGMAVTGISVYFKAREDGEAISKVRVCIAKGERKAANIVFEDTASVDIQPGEEKEVSFSVPLLKMEPGDYYIQADADQICSSGFEASASSTEYNTWYSTYGEFLDMEKCVQGSKHRIAVKLSYFDYPSSRTDELDSNVEKLRADMDSENGRLQAELDAAGEDITSLQETEGRFKESFACEDFTDHVQNLIEGGSPYLNYTTSTFTGWGSPIGPAKDFNTVVFHIQARAANTDPIDTIRCVVTVDDKSGEVLADDTQTGFAVAPGEDREIHFRLPVHIANEAGAELFATFICDQHISVYSSRVKVNLNPPDYGKVVYTANSNTPPFPTDLAPKRWQEIYDPDLDNRIRTYIYVERQGKRYILSETQMAQVEKAVASGLTASSLSETQKKEVSKALGEASLNDTQKGAVNELIETWSQSHQDPAPRIILPDRFIAAVGDTLQLFYRGLVEHPWPYLYNIEFKCNIGRNTPRYFEVTPTADQVKEYKLTVNVRDMEDNILSTADTILEVVAPGAAPAANKNILCIGDSLTSSGIWCAEAERRLTKTGGTPEGLGKGNIAFIGTKKNGTTGYEGYGGWTWASYLAEPSATKLGMWVYCSHDKDSTDQHSLWKDGNGNLWSMETIESNRIKFTRYQGHTGTMPAGDGTLTHSANASHTADISFTATQAADGNPFWDTESGAVSFKAYCGRNGFSGIDYVYTLLTWNGYGGYNAQAEDKQVAAHVASAKKLIRIIHGDYPEAKVKVLGLQMPSLNGGCGANYGAASSYSSAYGLVRSVMGMNLAYQAIANDDEFKDYVEFINISGQFDSENNMPQITKAVNTRSTTTEQVGTNGVHPTQAGYYQIGDAVYRNMCARVLE